MRSPLVSLMGSALLTMMAASRMADAPSGADPAAPDAPIGGVF